MLRRDCPCTKESQSGHWVGNAHRETPNYHVETQQTSRDGMELPGRPQNGMDSGKIPSYIIQKATVMFIYIDEVNLEEDQLSNSPLKLS